MILKINIILRSPYYIPPPLTVHFPITCSVRYQPILHTLYYTLHTEHAYCLSYRFLNNVVITTIIEMVEIVEILDGRLGKRSVERVLVLCISTRLRLVTILSQLVKYLVIFHADPCNKSYIPTDPITLPCSLARTGKYPQCWQKLRGLCYSAVSAICLTNEPFTRLFYLFTILPHPLPHSFGSILH